jgi:hypothetical protein
MRMAVYIWYILTGICIKPTTIELYRIKCFKLENYKIVDRDVSVLGHGKSVNVISPRCNCKCNQKHCKLCFPTRSHFEDVFKEYIICSDLANYSAFIVKVESLEINDELLRMFFNNKKVTLLPKNYINDNGCPVCQFNETFTTQGIPFESMTFLKEKCINLDIYTNPSILLFLYKNFPFHINNHKFNVSKLHISHFAFEFSYINPQIIKINVYQMNNEENMMNKRICCIFINHLIDKEKNDWLNNGMVLDESLLVNTNIMFSKLNGTQSDMPYYFFNITQLCNHFNVHENHNHLLKQLLVQVIVCIPNMKCFIFSNEFDSYQSKCNFLSVIFKNCNE